MGFLIEHIPHDEAQYHELSLAIPCADGAAYSRLSIEDREAIYQAVLDAIRLLGDVQA